MIFDHVILIMEKFSHTSYTSAKNGYKAHTNKGNIEKRP